MTASRRLVTLPLLALALVAVLLVPVPPPAEAQTMSILATTLVKNTGQSAGVPRDLSSTQPRLAQQFTAGTSEAGYTLSSIGIDFNTITQTSFVGGQLTVTLNANSSGSPGAALCTLSDPDTFSGSGVHTFVVPATCPTLAAGTAYFVVVERSGFFGAVTFNSTSANNEDAGGATGWSIGNDSHQYGSGSWGSFVQSLRIEIKGSVFVPPPPVRVTGFGLDSGNIAPTGMWGNEDTFWVVNNGAALGNKVYAYDRADGSRDSANDFDGLSGASNSTPTGICSDGTTMFVADSDDGKLYAYKMSDTTRDSTKDITLNSANGQPRGVWCDETTVYVANDGATSANKIFAYKIADGTHDTAKDFEQLYVSTDTAAQNAEAPWGIWSDGTTMFVADSDDDNVFAYKHSDESQDSAKNLALTSGNDDPVGMWFDGRVLWVVDETDDKIYAYDLPGAQPDNTPATGAPQITSAFAQEVFTATVTPAEVIVGSSFEASGYATAAATAHSLGFGSISESLFTVDGVAYTVLAVFDDERHVNSGDLVIVLDRELPRGFTFKVNSVSYSSADAAESEPGAGLYQYQWAASLHWPGNVTMALNVETPKEGVEVSADVSGITDSSDGVASAAYDYQWIRVDGADEADIDGETGAAYTPTADDVGKHLKVRVVFDDDAGNREYPRTSPRLGPVAGPPPEITSVAITSTPATAGTYIIGEAIVVTVTFDKVISLGTGTDNPYSEIRIGTRTVGIDCTIGITDNKTLTCTASVSPSAQDTDGISIEANALKLGADVKPILGPLGQLAVLTHGGLADDSDHKVDGVRPELTGARPSADKSKIILTFSEVIGTADRTKITFDSSGTTLTTTGTTAIDIVTQQTVTITLDTALTASDTDVTVALAAGAVTDAAGNGNAVLAATALVDDTPPALSSTSTPSNTEVLLTYDEPLDPDSVPAASAFTVVVGAEVIWSATLTVKDIGANDFGCDTQEANQGCEPSDLLTDHTFSYDSVDYTIEQLYISGGQLILAADKSIPAAARADLTLDVGGRSFAFADAAHSSGRLTWTGTGLAWSEDDQIALGIVGGGTARAVSAASASGTSGIVLTVSPAFRPGDTLTVDYTVPGTSPIRDIAENEAAALDILFVDNTLAPTAPEAVTGMSSANTSTFGEVGLQWDGGTWANGSAITGHEVRYRTPPIWSATLTVGDLGSNFLGCDTAEANKGCLPAQLLSDAAFSYDSVNYLIDSIDLIGGQLRLHTNKLSIPAAALADLTLDVGASSFAFADAAHSSGILTWTGTGLSWSEDDTVSLGISVLSGWTAVADSAPGGANATSHTLEGLDLGAQYTFEVRAVNDVGGGGEASDTLMLLAPEWSFTLRDSGGSDVTGLTEGGASATATVTITNAGEATFGADQEIALEWGGIPLTSRIRGAGNTSAITIAAGASSGSLVVSAPDNDMNPVYIPETHDLTAKWADAVIATIEQFRRIEDESPPVARIADAPESVNEGDTFDIDIELSVRYPAPGALKFTITDSDSALSGTLPDSTLLVSGLLDATVTLTAAENTTQNDGAREVTFALETSTDIPYTLGAPHTVTVIVRDDDTAPLAVGNLRAQAGNTEATLRWSAPAAPAPDHGQPVLHYEYRVKEGTNAFGAWTMVPGSDGATTSHKFTGLTNGTVYAYEVRAENVAGDGAETSVTVTPRVGVAVSFASATASVTEGGAYSVVVLLDEAPSTGVTVVVPITATRGAGLGTTEYSGVPASVTFNAGDTSEVFAVTMLQDMLDEDDEVLTLGLGALPSGYVPGTNDEIAITVADDDTALLGFTVRDSGGNDVTELVEGGASATATVWITNSVRFETDQTVTLEWGGQEITSGPVIQGAAGSATVTIAAGQSSGTLAVSAPQRPGDLYHPPVTETLTAAHGGSRIGGGIDLRYVDDEDPPVFTISLEDSSGRSGTRVVEGGTVRLVGTLSRGYDLGNVFLHAFAMGATTRIPALGAVPIDGQPNAVFAFSSTESGYGLTPTGNSAAGDHATVTFAIPSNPDYYTIGTASTATLLILDDDAAPGAPRNIAARPGDTEATLGWDHPATYDQIWAGDYQYRRRAGTGPWTSWAAIGGSDGETVGHTFTGLTNEVEHAFEIRARNANHNGAVAQVQVTPREGIAVSFGAASASVTEGGSATVTLTLAVTPAAGTTVTAPITATPGTGLDATEYSGVPASVTFNAGDTSKTFTVTTVDNTDDEPHRTLTLGLGTLPDGYVAGTHHEFVLTLLDDDVPVVSATFDPASASVPEGAQVSVTVRLSQAPEREVALTLSAARGANLDADEFSGVPAGVIFAADATEAAFTVTFGDDAAVEGNETLTLGFVTPLPGRVTTGANPRLVVTVTDDDGPPAAPDVSVGTSGDGFVVLSWAPVVNDSPVLRYEVRWRRTDGATFNAWESVGLVTGYRVEGLTNGVAYVFEVQAVNAHGSANAAQVQAMATERLTGTPKGIQGLWVRATDSGRAELSWGRPSNATDRVTANSATATFSQIQGYRIEVCRTTCVGDEAHWYALVANTGRFEHRYTHQVLAPGVIRENHYRVRAININGVAGPWSNTATLDDTVVEGVYLQTPDDSTLWVRFGVRNPDGNPLYVRYTDTATGAVGYAEPYPLLRKEAWQAVKLVLGGLDADSWYRVDLDFSPDFDSPRRQRYWHATAREGETPLTSPYARDLVEAQVLNDGAWHDASTTALRIRMGEQGKYRVRLKPCTRKYNVNPQRVSSPAGRLATSPIDTAPTLFTNLWCEVEGIGFRTDENGNELTMSDVYDMTNFPDRANDRIPIFGGTPNDWHEVTVTAAALEDYPYDRRYDALLSAPFEVKYNHRVSYARDDTRSGLVSGGTGWVRILVDRPADAVMAVPTGVEIGSDRVMSWDAVPGAWGYLVVWRHGLHYSNRANQGRNLQAGTSITLPPGPSGRGPVTARVRAYSNAAVSGWSSEHTWDSRAPTLRVFDAAANEADGSAGFLVTLDPAASGTVTVDYTTADATAVASADYTATSGTLTFAPGQTRKTVWVPITDDGEEDTGETFGLVLSNPAGRDANNGAAVIGDGSAVATILNSEREAAWLTGFTLVDAGTNADLMALADGSTVQLGELAAASYGIRTDISPGLVPGSVRFALSGAKTATSSDDAAPYSLYGDGAGRVNGQALPAGAYTLRATAYADPGGQGDVRGSLEVSFTVTAGATTAATPGASDTGTGNTASGSTPVGADDDGDAAGGGSDGGGGGGGGGDFDVGVATFVVANGWSAADVGVASVLAARTDGAVVVYTASGELSSETRALLREALPAEVVIVGGTSAVSRDVRTQIRAASPDSGISRESGVDRADTAAATARRILGAPAAAGRVTLIVANGWSPPDIGAAAALAARSGRAAVLYTEAATLSEASAALLRDYDVARVILVGGTAAIGPDAADAVADAADGANISRLTGDDRIDTAAQAARRVLGNPAAAPADVTLVIANGWSAPDVGVAAALAAATDNAAVAYTAQGMLPEATASLIRDYRPTRVIIVGGRTAVAEDVRTTVTQTAPDSADIRRITGQTRTDTAARAARRTLANL
ncbi:Calx-beta domain-containing protein [Candidatus Poriferisodalis sp.]|uniref:Calx-beta domain-containing protein n=1 Tax=Candidatus Poriferisodalis sp. TaxID=3101277 RepID=UPI003AF56EBF